MAQSESLVRLSEVTRLLSENHRELAQVLAAEREGKVESWMSSEHTSIQARDRTADAYAVSLTVDVFKLKGEIAALEVEERYLYFLLSRGED